jgi:hypothetical protein
MAHRLIAAATLVNVITFPFALVAAFGGFVRFPGAEYGWGAAVVLNALVFLFHYRHAHRNASLTQAQRDRWEIMFCSTFAGTWLSRSRSMPANSAVAPDANRWFTVFREPRFRRAVRAGEPQAVGRRDPPTACR